MGLVTDGNTEICYHGFILSLFKALQPVSLTLNNTLDCKSLFLVCEVELLQVTVNKNDVYYLFMFISGDFWLKVLKNS